eukprot:CAMPEP_0118662094 /NCGR_PEP_ID=MMETSP0785-20121206/16636_1 /TAXON_ID=91992 /ORGANISM="Bolidomonas pacifica, Strain CCMP 1866" /LENGTH=549 /DNA_ID=CAMNT_0006555591 /DNA_START=208 /DNA_END=1857 /DNA_ORIENTATION=-
MSFPKNVRKVSIDSTATTPLSNPTAPLLESRFDFTAPASDSRIHLPSYTVVPGQRYPMFVLKRKGTSMWEANVVVSVTYTRKLGLYGSREAAQKALDVLSILEPNVLEEGVEVDLEGIVSPFGNPFASVSFPKEDGISSVSSESDDEVKRRGVEKSAPAEPLRSRTRSGSFTATPSATAWSSKSAITRDEMKAIASNYFGICLDHTKYRARRVNKSLGCYTYAAEAAWVYDKNLKDSNGKVASNQRLNFPKGKKQFEEALAKEVAFREGRGGLSKEGKGGGANHGGGARGKRGREKEVNIAEARRLRAEQREKRQKVFSKAVTGEEEAMKEQKPELQPMPLPGPVEVPRAAPSLALAQQQDQQVFSSTATTPLHEDDEVKASGKWKKEELHALRSGIAAYGRDWAKISYLIPSRSREQVKNKGYALILEDETPNKLTGHWKIEELDALRGGIIKYGSDWQSIAKGIPSRSWSQVVRKGKHMIDNGEVVIQKDERDDSPTFGPSVVSASTPNLSSNTTVSSENFENFSLEEGGSGTGGLLGVVIGLTEDD